MSTQHIKSWLMKMKIFPFLSDAATELHVSNSRLREIESINAALKSEVRNFETLL